VRVLRRLGDGKGTLGLLVPSWLGRDDSPKSISSSSSDNSVSSVSFSDVVAVNDDLTKDENPSLFLLHPMELW